MKNDDREMWSIAYVGSMLAMALGRAARGTAFEKGHINDMDAQSQALADKMIATIRAKAP